MSGYQPEDIGFETVDQQRWRNYLNGVNSTDKIINVRSWQYIIEEVDDMSVQVLSAYPQLVYVSAEDLRQSILLKMQDPEVRLQLFRSTAPHKYLARMVQNHAIDLLRQSRVERKVFREFLRQRLRRRKSSVPDEKVLKLQGQIAKLNPEELQLVEMRLGRNLSFKEISEQLGIKPSAAATRWHRLKEKLRGGMDG